MHRHNNLKKGSALILTTITTIVLVAAAVALIMQSTAHYKSNRAYRALMTSQYSSRGALGIATYALNLSNGKNIVRIEGVTGDWDSVIYTEDEVNWKKLKDNVAVLGTGTDSANQVYLVRNDPLRSRGNRHFRVYIEPNGSLGFKATACSSYDREGYGIIGYFTSRKVTAESAGVTGYERVVIGQNAVVDSYNSQGGIVPYSVSNMKNNGDVASNGDIYISGTQNPMVYGSAVPGPGHTVTGAYLVEPSKNTSPRSSEMPVPSELDNDWLLDPTSGDLNVHHPMTISTSTHYKSITLQDAVTIDGDVTLYCHGKFNANAQGFLKIKAGSKLTLYVNGDFVFNGGFECADMNPRSFTVKVTQDARNSTPVNVDITGSSKLYAVVDAPWSNIRIGGSTEVFGAIIGYRVDIGSSGQGLLGPHYAKVHYDESLKDIATPKDYFFLNATLKGPFQDMP